MSNVLHMSYMTGDIFGVTAALALDPSLNIIFVHGSTAEGTYAQNIKFYNSCGLASRLKVVDVSGKNISIEGQPITTIEGGSKVSLKGIYQAFKEAKSSTASKNLRDRAVADAILGKYGNVDPIERVTDVVADRFKSGGANEAREKISRMWKVDQAPDGSLDKLREYMGKYVSEEEEQVVVLWSRQSGKRGGAHVELDSGFTGISQLASNLVRGLCGQRKVILVGDDRDINNTDSGNSLVQDTKLKEISRSIAGSAAMSSFWKSADYKDIWNGDEGMMRAGQILLWKDLAQRKQVVHVGMRSGNLETFALLGMNVVYMEMKEGEGESGSGNRMLAFREAGIPYVRHQIEHSPTLTGQYAHGLSKTMNQGITGAVIQQQMGSKASELMTEQYEILKQIGDEQRKESRSKWEQGGRQGKFQFQPSPPLGNKKELQAAARGEKPVPDPNMPPMILEGIQNRAVKEVKTVPNAKGFSDKDLVEIAALVEQGMKNQAED